MVGFPDDASLVSVDVSLPQEYDRFLQRQLARHQKTDVPEIPKMIFPYINPSLAGGVHPYSYPAYSGVGYNLVDWSEFGGGIADGFNSTIDGVKYLFTHPGDSIIHLSKMISTNPMDIPYKYKIGQTMISDIVTYTTESSGSRVAGRAGYEIIVTGLGAKGVTSAPKLMKGIDVPEATPRFDRPVAGDNIGVNLRSNNETKLLTNTMNVADHHIIPAFRGKSKEYAEFIASRGIDVDQFTVTIAHGKASHHLKFIHGQGQWNQKWMDWIDANPNATSTDIYQFAGKMMDDYGLSGLQIHPYKQK